MFRSNIEIRFLISLAVLVLASTAMAQVQPGTQQANADWVARATASSAVLYATNFADVYLDGELDNSRSGINSQAALHSESFENGGSPDNQNVTVNNSILLSGSNSCQIITPGSAGRTGGGYFAFRPDGRSATVRRRLYAQFSVYYPKETLGYRYLLSSNANGSLKTMNLGQYGAGQAVISNSRFAGYPSIFINGSQGISSATNNSFSNNPWLRTIHHIQPAVDSGIPEPISGATKTEWLTRYGPLTRGMDSDMDTGYDSSNPYLYDRAQPFGFPDARAAINGVPFVLDGWTTIEVFLEYNESNPSASTIRMWAAPYGEAPTLIIDEVGTVPFNSNSDNSWNRFELLNYDTERQSEAARPTMNTYYDEVIVSTASIDFPGGFDLESGGSDSGGNSSNSSGLSAVPAPAWVNSLQPGTWEEVSLNTLSDVDPENDPNANPNYPGTAPWHGGSGQRSVFSAWSGAALAYGLGSHGSLIAYGGGHNDYYGSEVYSFDLNSRTWERLSNPYPGPFNWPYVAGEYPDGSAIPPHTYDYVSYHPGTNSFIVMKGQDELGPPSNQTNVDVPHLFDLDTREWRRGPINLNDPNLFSGGYSAYDSRRDLFWANGGSGSNNFVSFDPNGNNVDGTVGSWSTYPNKVAMTDSQAEYDPVNDIMLITAFRNDSVVAAVDLKSPTNDRVLLNETGTMPDKNAAHGWSWSSSRGSVLYFSRTNGANVYEFKHKSGTWKDGQWAWNKLTAPGNNVSPDVSGNGIYSKFKVVSYADAEVAVFVNSSTGPVYAFKVPDAIQPKPPSNMN